MRTSRIPERAHPERPVTNATPSATGLPDRVNGESAPSRMIRHPDVPVPRIERRRSSLHGWGVFALEPIAKNRRIIAYTGEKIRNQESLARERRYLQRGRIWCFKLNSHWVIDGAVGGNVSRYINHSCTPNCYTQIIDGIIWVRAARNIRPGEELTYNYYTEGEGRIACRCQPGCKARL